MIISKDARIVEFGYHKSAIVCILTNHQLDDNCSWYDVTTNPAFELPKI